MDFYLLPHLFKRLQQKSLFFNKSSDRNVEVTYQYCYYEYEYKCTQAETITINHKNRIDSGYVTVQVPQKFPIPLSAPPYMIVKSALEKNDQGVVIAKGQYEINDCKFDIQSIEGAINVGVELSDNGSPIILCRAGSY